MSYLIIVLFFLVTHSGNSYVHPVMRKHKVIFKSLCSILVSQSQINLQYENNDSVLLHCSPTRWKKWREENSALINNSTERPH